jgi:hypothetical protein
MFTKSKSTTKTKVAAALLTTAAALGASAAAAPAASASTYHGGTACLTASDGTRTCTFGISSYWDYLNNDPNGYAHLHDLYLSNNTGRCIQVTSIRYWYASGAYLDRLGDAGGVQVPSGGPSVKIYGSWPNGNGGAAYTSPTSYVTVSVAACSRPGLNGTASAIA